MNGATVGDSSADGALFQIYTDNAQGYAPIMQLAELELSAGACVDLTWALTTGTGTIGQKTVILNGKKIRLKAGGEDFTDDGNLTIYLIFRRLSAAATIAAG